jgi:2-phospho-L-lactate transferase/gluconeogenesis factor (CofD/UPF0052 family)
VSSIGPILALDGVADAVRRVPCRIAASPTVLGTGPGGAGVRHHARARQRLLAADGDADTPADIARRYAGLVQHFVLDRTDSGQAPEIERLALKPTTCDLLDPGELARALVGLSGQGRAAGRAHRRG